MLTIRRPAEGNTLDAYRSKAVNAPDSTAPADKLPVGGARVLHIDVGLDGKLAFTPSDVQELPRTIAKFSFNPKVGLPLLYQNRLRTNKPEPHRDSVFLWQAVPAAGERLQQRLHPHRSLAVWSHIRSRDSE